MTERYSPDSKEALHYLSAIKVRLELLYEHSIQDARLLEHLSDEVDWVDAEIERLRVFAKHFGGRTAMNTDLENTRRELIALRKKHDAASAIGIRCSNIVELLEAAKDATGEHLARATANIQQQMADLQRLLSAPDHQ